MGALALVPHRRIQVATNVLVAIGTVFLVIQLVRIYAPPTNPVSLDLPLVGEWTVTAGGRSALLSHHYKDAYEKHAVDFVQLVEGRAFNGDPKRGESWYGFGEPVLAPADGTVVSVSDLQPDEPIGAFGAPHGEGNNIILRIGDQRYAMLSHLKQGSVQVNEGDLVRSGQPIAAVGDSGNSLGPHLHFQVQRTQTSTCSEPAPFRCCSATLSSSRARPSRVRQRQTSGAATTFVESRVEIS
jgi:Peptidase family M23